MERLQLIKTICDSVVTVATVRTPVLVALTRQKVDAAEAVNSETPVDNPETAAFAPRIIA
jgi:hypothetical protein